MTIGLCAVGLQNRLVQLHSRRASVQAQLNSENVWLRENEKKSKQGNHTHWTERNQRVRTANQIVERCTNELATIDAEIGEIDRN